MARSRNIKPGFFTNELLGTYDPIIPLLFAGLWCLADKDGRLEDRPLRIKAELFPYREGLDINGYLTVLARDGFISRYSVDVSAYIQIENFAKHQTPHHTERPRGYPEKPKEYQASECKEPLAPLSNGDDPLGNGKCKVPTRSDSLIPDSLIQEIPTTSVSSAKADDENGGDNETDDGQDAGDDTGGKVTDLVPYQKLVDAYNERCGELFPRVSKLTDKRRRKIRAAWKFDTTNQDERRRTNSLDYWSRYFDRCTNVEHFRKAALGENTGQHAGWMPGFDFLIREDTWLGVREGRYAVSARSAS